MPMSNEQKDNFVRNAMRSLRSALGVANVKWMALVIQYEDGGNFKLASDKAPKSVKLP